MGVTARRIDGQRLGERQVLQQRHLHFAVKLVNRVRSTGRSRRREAVQIAADAVRRRRIVDRRLAVLCTERKLDIAAPDREQRSVDIRRKRRFAEFGRANDVVGNIVEPRCVAELATDHRRAQRRRRNAATDRHAAGETARRRDGGNDVEALGQAIGKDLLEAISGVRPALVRIKIILPVLERQVAAHTDRALDEILHLVALVDSVIRKRPDPDRAVERPGTQERRNQRAVDRIVDGELTLPVLVRLAAGGQHFEVDLGVARGLGIEGTRQVAG